MLNENVNNSKTKPDRQISIYHDRISGEFFQNPPFLST